MQSTENELTSLNASEREWREYKSGRPSRVERLRKEAVRASSEESVSTLPPVGNGSLSSINKVKSTSCYTKDG